MNEAHSRLIVINIKLIITNKLYLDIYIIFFET